MYLSRNKLCVTWVSTSCTIIVLQSADSSLCPLLLGHLLGLQIVPLVSACGSVHLLTKGSLVCPLFGCPLDAEVVPAV